MNLLKAWNFIKKSSFVGSALALTLFAQAQKTVDAMAYILKPGITKMTKTQFLNSDSISVLNCENCYRVQFSIVIGVNGNFQYQFTNSNQIPDDIKNIVKGADSCTVSFVDMMVYSKGGGRMLAPLVVKIK